MKNLLVEKKFIWGNLIILGHFVLFDWAWSKIGPGHCYYWILKQSGHDLFQITTGSLSTRT